MFIDVENSEKLFFNVLTTSADDRAFSIKITQLRDNLAPQGCLQYFSSTEGIIQSFNFEDYSQILSKRKPSYFVSINPRLSLAADYFSVDEPFTIHHRTLIFAFLTFSFTLFSLCSNLSSCSLNFTSPKNSTISSKSSAESAQLLNLHLSQSRILFDNLHKCN